MEREYKFTIDDKMGQLVIHEYAKMDRGISLPLCKETYELKLLKTALREKNQEKFLLLKKLLRTKNIYPPDPYMKLITEAVSSILEESGKNPTKISFNDKAFNIQEPRSRTDNSERNADDIENVSIDIDKLMSVEDTSSNKTTSS